MELSSIQNINKILSFEVDNVYICRRPIDETTGKVKVGYCEMCYLYHEYLILKSGPLTYVLEYGPIYPYVKFYSTTLKDHIYYEEVLKEKNYSLLAWIYAMVTSMWEDGYNFITHNCQHAVRYTIMNIGNYNHSLMIFTTTPNESHFQYDLQNYYRFSHINQLNNKPAEDKDLKIKK